MGLKIEGQTCTESIAVQGEKISPFMVEKAQFPSRDVFTRAVMLWGTTADFTSAQ